MQNEIIVDSNYYIYFIGKHVLYYFTSNSFNKNLPEKHSYGTIASPHPKFPGTRWNWSNRMARVAEFRSINVSAGRSSEKIPTS